MRTPAQGKGAGPVGYKFPKGTQETMGGAGMERSGMEFLRPTTLLPSQKKDVRFAPDIFYLELNQFDLFEGLSPEEGEVCIVATYVALVSLVVSGVVCSLDVRILNTVNDVGNLNT